MNKDRRKAIADIVNQMGSNGDLDGLADQIEAIRDEEQEAYENLPESFQNGDAGAASQAASEALDEAASAIRAMKDSFDEALAALETAGE